MFSLSGRRILQNPFIFSLLLSALLFIVPTVVHGQGGTDTIGTGGKNTIQGRIFFPSGRSADVRAKVRLESTTISSLFVIADTDGAFKFRNVGAGSYTIVVEAGDDYEVARESVYIDGPSSLSRGVQIGGQPRNVMVPIYLQLKMGKKTDAKPGVLNAALANIPKAAVDFYTAALEAVQAGDSKKAVEKLKAAISLYPNFAIALNELGVQYLKLGQPDKAVEALRSAVGIAPDDFTPRLNYGIALLEKKDFAESEAQLRQALKKNNASPVGHLYLGLTLISLRSYVDAEGELKKAVQLSGGNLSLAHYYLGGLYWKKGEYKHAVEELETYLKQVPNSPDAERLRATIKELRSKT